MPTFNQQLRWQADLGTSPGGAAPGRLVTDDSIVIAAGSALVSIDRYTGAQKFRHVLPLDPRYVCSFGGQLVVTDDGNDSTLYVVNPQTGQAQRFISVQGYVNWMLGVGQQLFAASDKQVYLIGLQQRHWQVIKQGGPGSAAPAVYSGGLLYCTTSDGAVVCFDLSAFAVKWQASVNGAVLYEPCLDGQVLYVGTGGGKTVYALDALTGAAGWHSGLPAPIVGNIAAAPDRVYAPCQDSTVYALGKSDGGLLERVPLTEAATSSILVNPLDSILYAATASDVLAYAPDTGNELSYGVGSWPYLIGTNASDIYAGGGQKVYSINFTEVLKQFSVDSTLIQDFEPSGAAVTKGGGLTPVPYYNTEVFLHNPDQTPLVNTAVKLRSTAATTVKVGGQSYSLDPNNPVGLTTDGKGRLRIESRADGISTPPLLLWAPFLADTEEIVIYPDHQVHDDLATSTGDDLLAARDYGGNPILTGQYQQDATARDNAAQAIQGALGLTIQARTGKPPQPPDASARRGIPAEPASAVNAGAFFISNPAQLNPAMNLQTDWYLNLQPGGSAFETGVTTTDVEQWATANESQFQKRSFVGDLWDAIEEGAKVAEAFLYKTGEQILTSAKAFIDGAWQYFKDVVIDTVEKALKLVRGILNEIVESIDSALQWLSFVFDWDAILTTHEQIKQNALSTIDALASGTQLDAVKTVVSSTFNDLESKINDMFDWLRSGIGQESFNSLRPADGGQGELNANSTWLLEKTNQNIGPGAGGVKRSASDPEPTLDLSIGQGVIDALNAFLNNVKNDLTEDLYQTMQQLVNGFQSMSASDIFAGTLAAVLTVFQGVADMAVDVLKNFVLAVIDLLKALLQGNFLKDFLTAEIPIPFVKDVYQYLTGQPMSLIDIAALLIAIPVTVAERAGGSGAQKRSINGAGMVNFAYPFWGLADAYIEWGGGSETAEGNEGMGLLGQQLSWSQRKWQINASTAVGIGVPLLIQLSLIPAAVLGSMDDTSQVAPNVVLWVLPFAAIMSDLVIAILTKGAELARFEIAGQVMLLVIGLGILLSIILFAVFNKTFREGVTSLLSNVFLNMSLLFKLLRNVIIDGVKVGVYVVTGIDLLGNVVGGILGGAAAADG
jgi:outer membrane protein assembly factor BamB